MIYDRNALNLQYWRKMIYDRNALNLQYWHMHITSRGFYKPQYHRFNKQMLPINQTKHLSFYKSFALLQDVFNYFKEQNRLSSTIGGNIEMNQL